MKIFTKVLLSPNGEPRRQTPAGKARVYPSRSHFSVKKLRHPDFLGIRQSTVNCSTHPKIITKKCSKEMEVNEIPSACEDCLWNQRELRMTKEEYKHLQNSQKNIGKQPFLRFS